MLLRRVLIRSSRIQTLCNLMSFFLIKKTFSTSSLPPLTPYKSIPFSSFTNKDATHLTSTYKLVSSIVFQLGRHSFSGEQQRTLVILYKLCEVSMPQYASPSCFPPLLLTHRNIRINLPATLCYPKSLPVIPSLLCLPLLHLPPLKRRERREWQNNGMERSDQQGGEKMIRERERRDKTTPPRKTVAIATLWQHDRIGC